MMIFQNEEMVCIMSGRRQKANPDIESNWDCVVADGKPFYVSAQWREKSYKKRGVSATWELVLKRIVSLKNGAF